MRCFIADRYAAVWRPDGRCEFYIADVAMIDRLRTADLEALGLPTETMRALWLEAQKICRRADEAGLPELTRSPYLLWLDGCSGAVLERWESCEDWAILLAHLQEADHAS